MNVYVATENPVKLRAVQETLAKWSRGIEANVKAIHPIEHLPEQPLGEEVSRGAIARAKTAIEPNDADWGIGIEAGLIQLPRSDRWLSVQVCAIADREGQVSLGLGPGYELPEDLRKAVLAGEPLREAFERILGGQDNDRLGAIHYLSGGRLDRFDLTRQAVFMALLGHMDRING
jgi:inosine/xanthosine triphosphatase